MQHLKKFTHTTAIVLIAFLSIFASSCSSDNEPENGLDIVGTWQCVSSTRTSTYFYFNSDHTGSYEFIGHHLQSFGSFIWSMKGYTIIVKGAVARSDGYIDENWTQTLTSYGSYLMCGTERYERY